MGTGNINNRGDQPGQMGSNLVPVSLAGTFIDIFGKSTSLCAVESFTFKVKCWGENGLGQLGLGDTNDRGNDPGEMGSALAYLNFGSRTIKVDSTFSPSPTRSPTPPLPINEDELYRNLIIGSAAVVGVLFLVGAISAFFPSSQPNFITIKSRKI